MSGVTVPQADLFGPLDQRRPAGPLLSVWEDGWRDWSWDEWRGAAAQHASALGQHGVQAGDRVAYLLANTRAACAGVIGCWMAGACVVSLPTIARGMSREHYVSMLRTIVAQSGAVAVVAESAHLELMASACESVPVLGFRDLADATPAEVSLPEPDDVVFVQYSSGSTTQPRGCELSARAIAHQLEALSHALAIDPNADISVDWLPLSHDMGLFGCVLMTAYWTGTRQWLSTPQRFLMSPHSWFDDLAAVQGTITAGPNFALELSARFVSLLRERPVPVTRLVLGGECVRAETLDHAWRELGPSRLPRRAVLPAYGLAEAVLAVSAAPVGEEPRVIEVDSGALAAGAVSELSAPRGSGTTVVSVGLPLEGNEVAIAGDDVVGEVLVRSPSLARGYLGLTNETSARFTPDGLLTGDMGFISDGCLYVTGRADDLLVLAGRNVYAGDIERALMGCGGVRAGSCAVVQIDGAEPRLVVVAETVNDHPSLEVLAAQMAAAARSVAGVKLTECVFLPRAAFPKTPSGKMRRFACKELASDRKLSFAERVRC